MSKDNGQEHGLIEAVSHQLCPEIKPTEFFKTLKEICCKGQTVSNEEMMAFLMVCKEHHLNPILREIYPMRTKAGFQPVVGVDGWMKVANRHPQMDGMDIIDSVDDSGQPVCCTVKIHRKDRQHPVSVTEWFSECNMNTKPWQDRPIRMLRHKACIQAIRYAFNLSGIMDPEEARQIGVENVRQAERERDRLTIGPMKMEVEAAKAGVTVQELEEVSQEVYSKTYSLLDNAEAEIVLKTAIDSRQILDAAEDQGDTGDIRQPAPPDNQATSAGVAASEQEEFPL